MSLSVKELYTKSKYNITYLQELQSRRTVGVGLYGFNGEPLVYSPTEDIKEYTKYIKANIGNVTKCDDKEVLLFDAYASATIEGASTTIDQVRKAVRKQNRTKSEQMVLNTIEGTSIAIQEGINRGNIRHIWEVVTQKVCENKDSDGTLYRSAMVRVADVNKVVHIPCAVQSIPEFMQYIYDYSFTDPLLDVAILHFYFVYIHPFCDGNGRLARIWMYSDLVRRFHKNIKYVSISNEILKNAAIYYKTLKESEYIYEGCIDITTFIEFILECICNAIQKGLLQDNVLSGIEKALMRKINSNGVTVAKLSKGQLKESTVRYHLNRLVDKGFLRKDQRGRTFVYYPYDV